MAGMSMVLHTYPTNLLRGGVMTQAQLHGTPALKLQTCSRCVLLKLLNLVPWLRGGVVGPLVPRLPTVVVPLGPRLSQIPMPRRAQEKVQTVLSTNLPLNPCASS